MAINVYKTMIGWAECIEDDKKLLFCTLNDAPFFRLKEAISVC